MKENQEKPPSQQAQPERIGRIGRFGRFCRNSLLCQIARTCLRLCAAPAYGAIAEVRCSMNRKSQTWQEFMRNAACLYFAPITGAFKGIRRELKRMKASRHTRNERN